MQPSSTLALLLSSLLAATSVSACSCVHNEDAGRWKDVHSPSGEALELINAGGGCYQATVQGHMCITFTNVNDAVKDCLANEATGQESYHGDWFLWTAITCEAGGGKAQLSITK